MSDDTQTLLDVQGMSCPSCIRHINQALGDVDGVTAVEVRLSEGRVLVRHEGQGGTTDALVAALRDAGYAAEPVAA